MPIDTTYGGAWRELFPQALKLLQALPATNPPQHWTFGGGTVLMLRYQHRLSKDIDIFVDDPQVLGYLNPRLSEIADSITSDYEEAAEYVKLFLPQGEIDVVASRLLTIDAYEEADVLGQRVRVEKPAEIIAKKMYYRGNRAKGRDLFDFAVVLDREPDSLKQATSFLLRHRDTFIDQLKHRETALRIEFEAIDTLRYNPSFENCVKSVSAFLTAL